MVINHNMTAANTSRFFGIAGLSVADTAEKLSSGYRINRAADDAAGLTISEKLRWQVRGLNRASTNAQDGICLIQTAEGALDEVHSILQRCRELSVQAANDTNQEADRTAIQKEIDDLKTEVDRIAKDTEYNTLKLFDSSNVRPEEAAHGGVATVYTAEVDAKKLDMQDFSAAINEAKNAGKIFSQNALGAFADQLKDVYLPKLLGGIVGKFNDSATPTAQNMGIGLKMYYENNSTLAYVSSNGMSFQLGVNLKYLSETNGSIAMTDDLATTIAHEMTHAVMFDIVTNGMLGFDGADPLPSWFVEGTAQAVGGAMNYLGLMPSVNDEAALKKWMANLTNTSDSYNAYAQGYLASMYLGYVAGGGGGVNADTIANGLDVILKDISGGYSLGQAIARHTKYGDLADFEKSFSTDAIQFVKDLETTAGALGTGSIISPDGLAGTKKSLLGITSTNNYFTLDVDKNEVTNNLNWNKTYTGGGATTTSGKDRNGNTNPDAQPSWGSKLGNTGGAGSVAKALNLQVGSLSGQKIVLDCFRLSQQDLHIETTNVNTYTDAGNSIASFDEAISIVSDIRSYYGAMQNRLEHTIANLDNTSENTQSAESKLRDTDMADTMVEYSKANILQQAGQSMLAQANHSKEGVLSLLQ